MVTKKNRLKDRFVLTYDTLCEGHQCMMEGEEKKAKPVLFDSHDEAFKELFDSALSMLEGYSVAELKEIGVTKKKVAEMKKVFDAGDVAKMEKFIDKNPDMNYNGEWVQPAEEFIMNRKAIFGSKGLKIIGTKLK